MTKTPYNLLSPSGKYARKHRQEYIELLGGKCVRCSGTEDLHFDHVDQKTKSFSIAGNLLRARAVVLAELEKCQLLCKGCHKIKTRENWEFAFPPSKHGMFSMYTTHACRCDLCRAANAQHAREYYHKTREAARLSGRPLH